MKVKDKINFNWIDYEGTIPIKSEKEWLELITNSNKKLNNISTSTKPIKITIKYPLCQKNQLK